MGDLLETFFGGMGGMGTAGSRPDPRGDDLRYDVEITLEEAALGAERTIHFARQGTCTRCRGAGTESGGAQVCPQCRGAGQRRQVSSNFFGMQFATVVPCDTCEGTGEVVPNPCPGCGGRGRARKTDELQVKIPTGVDTGLRIRYRGKGDAGLRGAPAGDLMVMLHVKEHAVFHRRGDDLLCEVPLPFATATLGGKLQAPSLVGDDVEIDVPAGTPNGHTFRVRAKGMPHLESNHIGDLYVVAQIKVPTDLTPRQRELLHEFARERGDNVEPKHKNLFQKVKEVVEDAKEALGGV